MRPAFLALLTLAGILPAAAVDFSHQIVPLLREHCADCHMGDKKKGGFSMNDRDALLEGSENGSVISTDTPLKSHLLTVVSTPDDDTRMPPKGDRLTPAEVDLLRQWITEDLPWEPGFAFQQPAYEPPLRPREITLPAALDGRTHPIDRLVDAYLTRHDLPHPAPISDEAFLRRAHLDLIGLLPTPEERATFLADPRPDKRATLIDSLLARDTDYAEHWLTFWNDLLRNDYGGTGFITGGRTQISRWLYQALIDNRPYDQFARELIAPATPESAGFIKGIKWRGDVSAGQTVEIQFAQSVGQSFLGINLKCASCHDSFIDRWKLSEAYGLAAIYAETPLEMHRCDKPIGQQAQAAWLFPELGTVDPAAPKAERLQQLAALMTHEENGRFTRTLANRFWHRLMGRGIVHPLDAMQSAPWDADLLDYLGTALRDHGYDLKKLLALIATSTVYQSAVPALDAPADSRYLFKGPAARRLTAEQFTDAIWQLTGSAPDQIDAPILRGQVDPETLRHIQLTAQWIWGDSAAAGQTPPADETLAFRKEIDLPAPVTSAAAFLTCDNEFTLFINNKRIASGSNWSQPVALPLQNVLKPGVNTLVIVATNRGSTPNHAGLYFDARLQLTTGESLTLTSDATWQQGPYTTPGREGRLGPIPKKLPAVTLVDPPAVWTQLIKTQAPPILALAGSPARMVRASLMKSDFLMRSLGRPNRDQIVSMRPDEVTTLEAIDLSNGPTLAAALATGGQKLHTRQWPDSPALIHWIYHHTLTRDPHPAELTTALDLLGPNPTPTAIEDLLWAITMTPEFLFVR